MNTMGIPRVTRADETDTVQLLALGVKFLIDGDMTDGRFSVVEHPLPPRRLGAPVHTHQNEDEYSLVLAGRAGVQLGDSVVEVSSGDLVFKPRGVEHTFWNAADEPLRILEIITPAGFENYFREMAPLLAAPVRDDDAVASVRERYALEADLSSPPLLAERHRLVLG